MQHRIAAASANPDFTVEVRFADGRAAVVDLREFVATGVVTESLRRDPGLFVGGLRLGGDGAWLAWPGEVEIDAAALWYQAHPGDLARDSARRLRPDGPDPDQSDRDRPPVSTRAVAATCGGW